MNTSNLIDQYNQEGYLLVEQAVDTQALDKVIEQISSNLDKYGQELYEEGKISNAFKDAPFGKKLLKIYENSNCSLRTWAALVHGQGFFDLAHHNGIIQPLTQILGDNINFTGDYHVRPKVPDSEFTAFPFHQDSQYYGKQSQHAHIISVWIPLVDVDESNGCLFVIPGSHHWGIFESARDENENMRTFDDIESKGTPVPVPMKKGDILLFSNLTFHGSKLNKSDSVRWSVDLRYCRTPGTFEAPQDVLESEEFWQQKMKQTARVPVVVSGTGQRISFDEWTELLGDHYKYIN